MNVFDIDSQQVQSALNGGLSADALGSLIKDIEFKLESLIPLANHTFANIVTEAFDASSKMQTLRSDSMVSLMNESNRAVSDLLFTAETQANAVLVFDELPSPEMLFSAPENVPFIVRISSCGSSSQFNDCDLQMTGSSISSSSDPFGFSGFNSARLDA